MLSARQLVACLAVLLGWVTVGAVAHGGDQVDDSLGSRDRRGAVIAASNVFIGQVVAVDLPCQSAPVGSVLVAVRVERNLKGRVEGTVVVRQDTDDVLEFGPDDRMAVGEKYLVLARYSEYAGAYVLVDVYLGYELIDGPDERAEVVADVRAILDEPITPTPTIDADTRATWDAQSTVSAATFGPFPTAPPCEPEIPATPGVIPG